MSAWGPHVWKASEGEPTNPPVLSSLLLFKYWCWVCIYFSKYNYYFEYYVVDGHYFVISIFFCGFSQIKFSILVIPDWLISLYFFLSFIIPSWVQIGTNHTLPHPIMMTLLINYINTLLKKEWAQITHQDNFIITFLFLEISIISHEGGSELSTSKQEVTIIVPNKRVQ